MLFEAWVCSMGGLAKTQMTTGKPNLPFGFRALILTLCSYSCFFLLFESIFKIYAILLCFMYFGKSL